MFIKKNFILAAFFSLVLIPDLVFLDKILFNNNSGSLRNIFLPQLAAAENTDNEEAIRNFIDEGRKFYRQRQYKKAIEEWGKALKIDPENVKVKKYIERAEAKLGEKPEPAEEGDNTGSISTAKEDTASKVNELIDMGRNYYREGKYDDALSVWKEAYKLDPQNANLNRYMAKVQEKVKEKPASEASAGEEKPAETAPQPPEAPQGEAETYISKGKDFFRKGQYANAIAEWEKALSIDPNNEKVKKYVSKAKQTLEEEEAAEKASAPSGKPEEEAGTLPQSGQPEGQSLPPAQAQGMPEAPPEQMPEVFEEENEGEIIRRSLGWCVNIAIENHREAKIALEKIKKAEIDLFIARRSFFPNLFFNYSTAQGGSGADTGNSSSTRDFARQRYKFQARHLVYSGGKARSEVRKAKIALEIEQKDYKRVVSSKALEVAKAYYGLAKTEADLKVQKSLLKNAQDSLKLVEEQFKSGLVSELELLNLKALINQILSQLATAQQDVSTAVLELQKVMNIDITTPIRVYPLEDEEIDLDERYNDVPLIKNIQAFEISKQAVDETSQLRLDSYTIYALKSRSDFAVDQLKLKKAEKDVDIAKSRFRPQFEVYGELGQGAEDSIQRTNDLDMRTEYVSGIRMNWNIWGNTFAVKNEEKKQAPAVTEIGTQATREWEASVGILDDLAPMSEKQELVVKKMEALNDLAERKNTIIGEVRDAYHNFLKAKISKDTAKSKIEFRKKSVDLYNLQRSLGEVDTSKLVQGEIDLSSERIALHKALSDYYTQLASLDAAIGKDIFYTEPQEEISEYDNEDYYESDNEADNETYYEEDNEADNETSSEGDNEAYYENENEAYQPQEQVEEPEPQQITASGYIFKLEEVTIGPATHKIVDGYKYRKWIALARSNSIDMNEFIGKKVSVTGIPVKTEDWIDTIVVNSIEVIGKKDKDKEKIKHEEETSSQTAVIIDNDSDNEGLAGKNADLKEKENESLKTTSKSLLKEVKNKAGINESDKKNNSAGNIKPISNIKPDETDKKAENDVKQKPETKPTTNKYEKNKFKESENEQDNR